MRQPNAFRGFAAAVAVGCGLACGSESPPGHEREVAGVAEEVQPTTASPRRESPLPAFRGRTLDGQKLDISSFIGKRLLIYFFNPEVRDAAIVTPAVVSIAELRGKHNFEIVGVATGSDRATARAFADRAGVRFPVIDDSSARLAQRFGLRAPMAILGVDAEGYVVFGFAQFPTQAPSATRAVEASLRKALRLPSLDEASGSGDGAHPAAPPFAVDILDRDERFELAAHAGEPLVLIFFLHTCPHCHEALKALQKSLAELPADARPTLLGIEVSGRTQAVRQTLESRDLDFFPVAFDEDGSLQAAYGVYGGVPDIFLIDAAHRIRARTQGWTPAQDEPLMRMRLARLVGAPVPMLLRKNGFSGSTVCGVCHELEHETWSYTTHASAFDTLVKHGADTDPECVGCHVVGYSQPGGFRDALETPELEDVGCEACHGRGGPHLSPDFHTAAGYGPVCSGCHDPKHSLGFEFASFLPRISHAANAGLVNLPPEEKRRRLAERGRPGGSLLPSRAEYTGSAACKSCHAAEHATWAASPHARAGETLDERGKAGDAACLACHTTAYGRPGGFPEGGALERHPDLARVGCESCHGPGGDHVAEGAARMGTIVSLGDKCDSCVILQICGSCHDDANDPGFEFEVQAKIEAQRHGTIEPGTGRPRGASAARGGVSQADRALLARAFERREDGGLERRWATSP